MAGSRVANRIHSSTRQARNRTLPLNYEEYRTRIEADFSEEKT